MIKVPLMPWNPVNRKQTCQNESKVPIYPTHISGKSLDVITLLLASVIMLLANCSYWSGYVNSEYVFVLKNSLWKWLLTVVKSWRANVVINQLRKTFYWLEPVFKCLLWWILHNNTHISHLHVPTIYHLDTHQTQAKYTDMYTYVH